MKLYFEDSSSLQNRDFIEEFKIANKNIDYSTYTKNMMYSPEGIYTYTNSDIFKIEYPDSMPENMTIQDYTFIIDTTVEKYVPVYKIPYIHKSSKYVVTEYFVDTNNPTIRFVTEYTDTILSNIYMKLDTVLNDRNVTCISTFLSTLN